MKKSLTIATVILLTAGFLTGCSRERQYDEPNTVSGAQTTTLTGTELKNQEALKIIEARMKSNVETGGTLTGNFTNDNGDPYTVTASSNGTQYYAVTNLPEGDEEFIESGTRTRHCSVSRPAGTQGLPAESDWECGFGDGESDVYGVLAGYGYFMYAPTSFAEGGLSGNNASTVTLTINPNKNVTTLEGDFGGNAVKVTYRDSGDSVTVSGGGKPDTTITYSPNLPADGFPTLPAETETN